MHNRTAHNKEQTVDGVRVSNYEILDKVKYANVNTLTLFARRSRGLNQQPSGSGTTALPPELAQSFHLILLQMLT